MDVRILGPLEISVDGRPVELAAGRQRTLVAILALHANEVVSSERIIDELWEQEPPPTAHKALQNVISQLRSAIGPTAANVLVTRSSGYVLELEADALDARRFERLAAEGRQALEAHPDRAAKLLREALALWRGEPLADFTYEPFAHVEIDRLEELRLAALADRIEADLSLGRHIELVPELETLVASHPLDERLRGQLMLALYRSGRQAEALETYRRAREVLHDELGIEPSPSLRRLEQAILNQDDSLGPPLRLPPPALRARRRLGVLATVVGLIIAAGVAAILVSRDEAVVVVVPDSVIKIDPDTNEVVEAVPIGKNPGPLAVVGNFAFAASVDEAALYRVDLRSGEVATSGRYDASGYGIAVEGDSWLWVLSSGQSSAGWPSVARVDPSDLLPRERIRLARYSEPLAIAVGGGSLWVSETLPPAVSRWSLQTLRLERRYRLRADSAPLAFGFGDGAAWVADAARDRLLRIDAQSGRMTRIPVGDAPVSPVVAFGSVWVQMFFDHAVWRIDPTTARARAIIRVPRTPQGLAAGAGSLWATGHCDGVVSRIDPGTDSVVATIETGYYPRVPAARGGFVWVGVSGEPTAEC